MLGISHGNHFAAEDHPLVWACIHLRRRLQGGLVNFGDAADAYAYQTVYGFRHVVGRWNHHPRFAEVAKTFAAAKSFNHNVAVFGTAGYLFQVGNVVNLMPTNNGSRTADLYVRSGADVIRIEVKAPSSLHWPRVLSLDVATVESIARSNLKRIRGQIDGNNHGILAIATGVVGPGVADILLDGLRKALSDFRDNSGVVGVAGIASWLQATRTPEGTLVQTGISFVPVQNPNYSGPLRFELTDRSLIPNQ